jgi:hypothetical protein
MIDYCLKASRRAYLDKALGALLDEEGNSVSPNVLLDRIGTIEGVKGYHVNLRVLEEIDTTPFAKYIIDAPTTPTRVWA